MANPFQIFIAYSRKDTDLLAELRVHLNPLERSGRVKVWYDGKIEPGTVWENEIKKHIHSADIILLLISADAIASDYFYEKEVSNALKRHAAGEAKVVPFILRPCDWESTPLAALQALPKNGKPVTTWDNRDAAYDNAVRSLRGMIEKSEAAKKAALAEKDRAAKAAIEAEKKAAEAALAAQKKKEADALKKERDAAEKKKREAERKKKEAEAQKVAAEKARQRRIAEEKRKAEQKEKTAAFFRSPILWGSAFVLVLAIVFGKMLCGNGNDSIPVDTETTLSPESLPSDVTIGQPVKKDPCANLGGDTDGDGTCDVFDKCKTEAGPKQNDGCPIVKEVPVKNKCDGRGGDKDGDGICADQDCNDNNRGIAASIDSDGDGICDDLDECDNEMGLKTNNGCPPNTEEIFSSVENPPRYFQFVCELLIGEDKKNKCAQEALIEFITKKVKYPTEAKRKGIEGKVYVQFVVEKDGSISHVKVVRDIGGGCGDEAVRVVNMLPQFVPGKQRGQPVRSYFNLPVRFKL